MKSMVVENLLKVVNRMHSFYISDRCKVSFVFLLRPSLLIKFCSLSFFKFKKFYFTKKSQKEDV